MYPVAPPVEGRDWIGFKPIKWADLKGQVVVVLFWSFGCEASLLAARKLTELHNQWPAQVQPIAVHTPRFPYEDSQDRLAAAVARHRLNVPVLHDPDYITWNRYNPGGWPAMAVINPDGRVVGINAGTTDTEVIDEAVETELAQLDAKRRRPSDQTAAAKQGKATAATIDVDRPKQQSQTNYQTGSSGDAGGSDRDDRNDREEGSSLLFPAGVAVSPSGLIAIADGGNDRLLVGGLDTDLRTFRPDVELTDIDHPTAVAFGSDSVIYVIEHGTGSVLQVDLQYGTLDVLADRELAAPTALLVDRDGSVVVADGGHDVLQRIAPGGGGDVVVGTIAGSGLCGSRDGDAVQAELAQPVALARTSNGVAFCDAASSNVRLLTDRGKVLTITGNDFFDWGLVDGPAHLARLQRPGGMCSLPDGSLAISDTGNSRVRILKDRRVSTLGLSGLNQPTGIAALGSGHLLIADTDNHRLVVADPARKTGWPLAVYPAAMTSVWDGGVLET